ncbi:MAG: hypothetical protein H6737_30280 [Alphaproteobacteria bacterium]|nr:hypothetical protein [Alphaproteobacteria bacterium]
MSLFLFVLPFAAAQESCTDLYAESGTWLLRDTPLVLDRGALTFGERRIGTDVVGPPAIRGTHVAFVEQRRDSMQSDLVAFDAATGALLVRITAEMPRQPALSEDGSTIAYTNTSGSGLTAVWTLPFAGGEPVQHTNVGVVRTPGRVPEGFVEAPSNGLVFDGDLLVWEGSIETHAVRWSGGAR